MDRARLRLTAEDGAPRISASTVAHLRRALSEPASLYTLEGSGGQFCEGLDLDMLSSSDTDFAAGMASYRALLAEIVTSSAPVFALVDGVALGGGIGLVAAADMVIATKGSTFGLPETLIGLVPAVVFPYIVARMGVAKAKLLALGQAPLSAEDALRVGLVDEIAEDPERAFAIHQKRFARLDSRAVAHSKAIARAYMNLGDPEDAERRFSELLESAPTRARLARMARGAPPWIEDDEP